VAKGHHSLYIYIYIYKATIWPFEILAEDEEEGHLPIPVGDDTAHVDGPVRGAEIPQLLHQLVDQGNEL